MSIGRAELGAVGVGEYGLSERGGPPVASLPTKTPLSSF